LGHCRFGDPKEIASMPTKSAFLTTAFVAAMAALLTSQQASAATEVIVGVGFGSGYGYGGGYDDDMVTTRMSIMAA
jgi:hypothetical protein